MLALRNHLREFALPSTLILSSLFASSAIAQSAALTSTSTTSKPYKFEVATIKPADGGLTGTDIDPGGIVKLHSLPLKTMIAEAFNVEYWQIEGGEPWMEKNQYDVVGKPPDDFARTMPDTRHTWYTINDPRLREMLQALLIQRFSLKIHRSTKPGKIYLLETSGNTLALKPIKTIPPQQASAANSTIGWGAEHWVLSDTTMPQLAEFASGTYIHRPVVDRTGLTGAFDYRSPEAEDSNTFWADPQGSFLRMLKGAGLKLEPSTGDVETLVIDHAELPTPD